MLRLAAFASLAVTAALALRPIPASLLRSSLSRVHRTRNLFASQDGWVTGVDEASGQTYYYNEFTGQSQWEQPQAVAQAGAPSPAAFQDGWITCIDEGSGQTYYYNELTGQSQWEPPTAATAHALWRVDGFSGVCGFSGVAGFVAKNKYQHFQQELTSEGRPCQLPYRLGVGDEKVLSRWNMIDQALTVDKKQCVVECLTDGTATLTSKGDSPTLWRPPGGQWYALEKGVPQALADGDQVGLNYNDPEGAVFTILQEAIHGGY